MRLRTTILLAAAGTGLLLWALLATEQAGVGTRADGKPAYPFVLEDQADRWVYQQRGRWLPSEREPYVEEHSEYPQLATWMFGLPYLFMEHSVPVGRAQTSAEFTAAREDSRAYFDRHHVSMALGYFALLALTAAVLRQLGHSPGYALLLLLPGTAYFSFNRFDAWPAAFVALACLLQFRGRRNGAAAALALGAMMKWYPALLLPLFLAHNLWSEHDAKGRGGVSVGRLFAALPRAVLVPGLVAGAVITAILSVSYVGGGWEAVTHVYSHHAGRVHNPPSLAAAILEPWRWGLLPLESFPRVYQWLTVLQFLPAVLLALVPIRSRTALLWACLAVVVGFAEFGKVFSPQWICWVSPLALLLAPGRRTLLGLIVALELLIYLQIPLLFYSHMTTPEAAAALARGQPAIPPEAFFWWVSDGRHLLLFGLWAWSLAAFLRTVSRGAEAPAPALR
ncbi:MAG: hypothetical protein ACT4PU_11730 [Planctomycetota bacterium]